MNIPLKTRIIFDAAMSAALLSALAFRITGDFFHEWLGLAACAMFAFHNIFNVRWYCAILKGKYRSARILNTAVNALLLCAFAAVAATGIFQSKFALPFLGISETMALRQIHTTSAYWLMFLGAIHLGLKWKTVFKYKYIAPSRRRTKKIFSLAVFALILYGAYSWIDRGMFDKLFMGYSFDYWDEERPTVLFFCESASIILLAAYATNLGASFIASIFIQNKESDKQKGIL